MGSQARLLVAQNAESAYVPRAGPPNQKRQRVQSATRTEFDCARPDFIRRGIRKNICEVPRGARLSSP